MGVPQEQDWSVWVDAVSYRIPYSVVELRYCRHDGSFPVCPRCGITVEREYQNYCDRCGQCLGWDKLGNAVIRIG